MIQSSEDLGYFTEAAGLILGCLGMVGNGLLLAVLIRTRAGWNHLSLQMILPVCIVDLIASVLVVIREMLALYMGKLQLTSDVWFCACFGIPLLILPCLSIVMVSTMAVDRYHIVVRGYNIRCLWGWVAVVVLCGSVSSILMFGSAIYGYQEHTYSSFCRPNGPILMRVTMFSLKIAVILSGLLTVSLCHIAIYLHLRKNMSAFHKMSGRFLFILVAYNICWLPKIITSTWGLFTAQDDIPRELHDITSLGIILVCTINPLIAIGFQASLRSELCSLLRLTSFLPKDQLSQFPTIA
ncbi:hypothetical protein DSO57_1017842 [Entomophthora muscae]|uniref:Uncharacterized protein n=1 Tax=Entomophthora muscae TaxID=34485 RepID=A0ACC2U368_9FUNG|nr:hypothetical protein DSO57_1017842 [Entomophthora muscae]